jgi:hypothetical protein
MGHNSCFWLKAVLLEALERDGVAKASLQAARLGDREKFTLEQVARGYVSGKLSKHAEEIEEYWLKEYLAANPEDEDTKDSLGVIAVYPRGFYYAMDVEEDLDLEDLASQVDARSFDVVHFSEALTRITKALSLEGCHVAMLVDKDGYMKDLPDNMAGTLVYGHGYEIRGTVVFVLEDDKTYDLMPMKGLQRVYMFIQLLMAATGGLVRQPTSEELESIGDEEGQEIEEPKELTVPVDKVLEGISQCNLCIDTLFVTLTPEYGFASTEDLFYDLGLMNAIEKNIKAHGGYMIDEWQYVDARQVPMDIRSRVRFK